MTISELIKDWTPDQSKILRDYVRAQGVPRTSYYQLIAQPLGQMRLEIAAIFAHFIGCRLEDMTALVKLECFTNVDPFSWDYLQTRFTLYVDGIGSIILYGSKVEFKGYEVLTITPPRTLAPSPLTPAAQ